MTSHKQTTNGNEYTTGYTYGLSGQLLEQTYPSGRVVKNSYDGADGSLSQVQSKRSSDTYQNLGNGFIYNPSGVVTAMRLGNGKWENTVFNSRMQPTQIGLGNGVNSQNLLKIVYSYGTNDNNGNVQSQTITVPGVAYNFVQTYTYDELNRLKNAEELKNSVQQWEQTFTYDRFGNRNFDEANTTTLPKNCGSAPSFTVCAPDKKIVNPGIDVDKNRLDEDDDYDYDAVGNTTTDAAGRTFVYDAENRQIEVHESSTTVGEYFYDGDGKRIKKRVPAVGDTPEEITIFVYDASGKLIQEHSTIIQDVEDAKTVYTTSDHLGSPRINTDATGQVISRHDYHPFGEEVDRTSFSYGSDTIRKQFTGYERDKETGLDFAQARMYGVGLGRFTSPDPMASSVASPQSHNKYVYVENNPLAYVDPTGETLVINGLYANELLEELSRATGYTLTRCAKVDKSNGCNQIGQVLIDQSVARKNVGTSAKLAGALKSVIENLKDAKGGDVTVTLNTAKDDPKIFIDTFGKKTVDVGDLQRIGGAPGGPGSGFAAGQLGHILGEYSAAAVQQANYPGSPEQTQSGNPVTHSNGLSLESEVMSELDGEIYGPRTGGYVPNPYQSQNSTTYTYESENKLKSFKFTFDAQVDRDTMKLELQFNITNDIGYKFVPKKTQVPN